ncbi:MAG: starch-binding protein [Paludibacteraceae bacterium]|nr:starch-binding protein [Paludibacteraceae bacterium]
MKKVLFTKKIALVAALLFMVAHAFAGGRIYYAGGFSDPCIWAWYDGGPNVYNDWPGCHMNNLPLLYDNKTVYYVDIDGNCPQNIIFSDNGNNQTQTENLVVPAYDYLFTGSAWVSYSVPNGEFWTLSGQLGDDAGWTDHFTTTDGVNQTCTLTLAAGKEYYFKMRHINGNTETWYTFPHAITRTTFQDVAFSVSVGMDDNTAIATTIAGEYIFNYNTESNTLTITYPDALAESEINSTAVPAENEAVLIQAYYWAHEGNTATRWIPYGSIQWHDLNAQASELGKYFDLVWLAPSADTKDYTGFLPVNYSDQNNVWGSEDSLKILINSLHNAGAKVIADIVINHSNAKEGFCGWETFNFGDYGSYNPDWSWVSYNDEMFLTKAENQYGMKDSAGVCGQIKSQYHDDYTCSLYDGRDDGLDNPKGTYYWDYTEYNCTYSRDWAHSMKEVREMSRAYLTWMNEYIGYDGWRYDFAKGIHGSHIDDYNKASNAAFSVIEVFEQNIPKQAGVLYDTHFNTYVFDFPGKYQIMNNAIRNGWYQGLQGNAENTMLYKYKKHTVTFVDNHDTFREEYNLCGTHNTIGDEAKVIQANAFILAMPGVPCVFYPYWHEFKSSLKPMIDARHATRVHSESDVLDEAGDGYYRATITGKNGTIKLFLGPNSGWQNCPEGYKAAYVGNDAGFYYQTPDFMYIKHNWGGGENWSWKIMNDNGDGTFSVRGLYGGEGCNWSKGETSESATYIDYPELQKDEDVVEGQMALFVLDTTTKPVSMHIHAVKPIYFMNTNNWENVKAYAWSSKNINATWPGEDMTLEGTFNGHTVYSYAADDEFSSIIFNPGGDEGKTGDLEMHEGQCYVYGSDWATLGSMTTPLAIPSSEWASLYLPLNVTLPSGVYAYYASSMLNDEMTLTLLSENTIPAHTGVVVKGAVGNYTLTATADYVAAVTNLFGGTKVATNADLLNGGADNKLYVLSKSASSPNAPVFAPINTDIEIPAAKAYLLFENALAAPDGIRFVIAQENNTTDIKGVEASEEVIKQLRSGHLYIIRGGVEYNVLGQRTR